MDHSYATLFVDYGIGVSYMKLGNYKKAKEIFKSDYQYNWPSEDDALNYEALRLYHLGWILFFRLFSKWCRKTWGKTLVFAYIYVKKITQKVDLHIFFPHICENRSQINYSHHQKKRVSTMVVSFLYFDFLQRKKNGVFFVNKKKISTFIPTNTDTNSNFII